MVSSGLLDRRIVILRAQISGSSFNERVESYQPLQTLFARVQAFSDGERMRAGIEISQLMMRFVVRSSVFARSISARDRITFDGLIYDINGVKPLGRRDGIEITATARADKR